ncbi:Flp pilus assembly protein TadG [Actinoplanes lutulentus]|uniref:Flp pilus assembly protein TadG n=1 Tax=Actinoplanes lutulentus TaxID=1287878 RepID=A0A327Z658_9ACTN|nr:TadE family protein [Actinoplanes lutulentus]MBB2943256.1 Flp pilus assembly protein TadG [Actinoplanes lutulentus]RAK28317.1 Flp pilus assembly protein TadG [Actinoplanes lutulentus]
MTGICVPHADRPPKAALVGAGQLRARWRRAAAHSDTGAATAELVIAMPLLLLIIMMVIQAGVWMHATHVAQAAASRAATTAAAYESSAGVGRRTGRDTLSAIGSGVLKNPSVSVTRTATEVRVEIRGHAGTVVPGMAWDVRAVVVRPVERWVTGGGIS